MIEQSKIKITPRARTAANKRGISLGNLPIAGTGFQGGVCERDILGYEIRREIRITPLAKKMSEINGISLEDIKGTGAFGKVLKSDILQKLVVFEDKIKGKNEIVAESETFEASLQDMAGPDGKIIEEIISYEGVRRVIGERLSHSKFTAPHVYLSVDVVLDELLEFRRRINIAQSKKVSVTDFIVIAVVNALKKYPDVNVMLDGDKIIKYKSINIGLAVAAKGGLIVPVIKNAQDMSLLDISNESDTLIAKARDGKLLPMDYSGGTFTISNLGMFGIDHFTAIINPPEAAILAVSTANVKPVVGIDENGNERIQIKSVMTLTVSVDHRLIDGLLAAQFIGEIRSGLENPIGLVL